MTDDANRPLKVFLCHANSDAAEVRALYARLKADGVDTWLDKENVIADQDWDFEIRKAVRASDIVIVCLSQQFSQNGYRQNEARIVLDEASLQPEGKIFIIPARLDECDYPESLRRFQGLDMFEESGCEYLMRALHLRAEKIGAVSQSKLSWLNGFTSPVKKPAPKKSEPIEKKPVLQTENPAPKPVNKTPQKWNTQIIIAAIGAIATFPAILSGLPWYKLVPAAPDIVTMTPTNTVTFTPPLPTLKFTPALPTETNMPVFTPPSTLLSDEITDAKDIKMRLVPAGTFTMGGGDGAHEVYLDDYYMDIYEVTNAAYKLCVDNGTCKPPADTSKYNDSNYTQHPVYKLCMDKGTCKLPADTSKYNDSNYAQHPIVSVDWNMAKTYCEWRDARLPTEAEWEKAARGIDKRTYPWGERIGCSKANYNGSCVGDTTVVGSYESGKSPYGMYDMAGNVWEWMSSLYQPYPYDPNDGRENLTASGDRVLRGGSWYDNGNVYDDSAIVVHSADRYWYNPANSYFSLGFRCARGTSP